MKSTNAIIITAIIAMTGCAGTGSNYGPIVDMRGKDFVAHSKDLGECQAYATQLADAASSAATGAVVGAIFGTIVMAALGGSRHDRSQGAIIGALSGGTSAGVQGETNQRNVIRRCMAGRGYSVLH